MELAEAALARIAASHAALNAVIASDAGAALAAAAESDRRLAAGEARPLEGLPITIKDSFDVAGLPNTAGSALWQHRVPASDAPAVARLRAAGAVILGKTNVAEMLGDLQSANPVHGRSNNPHDVSRTPGGSSGGSAAAVAAGLSCLDLGSDLCGSIRWPALCCGVFGLKPGWGSVDMAGHVPPPPGLPNDTPMSTAGLLARSAADLALGRAVLLGAGGGAKPVARMRIALWADDAASPVAAALRDAVLRAGALLAEAGAAVAPAQPFALREAWLPFGLMSHAILALGLPAEQRAALAAQALGVDVADPAHATLRMRAIALGPAGIEPLRMPLRQAWARFFEDFDALVCPPANVVAIPHDLSGTPYDRVIHVDGQVRPYLDLMHWSAPASVADLPAAVAPVGRDADGLPLGVQIIATRGAEDTAIAIVAALESAGCTSPAPPG